MPVPSAADLQGFLGNMDVYLFDQVIKGRLVPGMKVLDAGCGGGRNIRWLLQADFEVWAVDKKEAAINKVQALAREVQSSTPNDRFQVAELQTLPFEDAMFDVVLCFAVLHFAKNSQHFDAMVEELWRVLKPGGMLLVRTASSTGVEGQVRALGSGWYHLPDGSDRYLVADARLQELTRHLGASLLEPLKSTVVHGQRSMTTWCLGKKEDVS